jgi:hypothetical protein
MEVYKDDKYLSSRVSFSEAESIENMGVWDPMPELTITSPYVHSKVDSNTYIMGNPMPESTFKLMPESTLSHQSGTLDLASDIFGYSEC